MIARPSRTNFRLPPVRTGGKPPANLPAAKFALSSECETEGECVQNKARTNSKVAQAPSVKCSAFATSLSEGG